MNNLEFDNLLVRSFSLDFLEVMWEIKDTSLDTHDFTMQVFRSESPMGPFDPVTAPFEDRYRFIDNQISLQNKWRQFYYQIVSTSKSDTTNVSKSDPFTHEASPDLIAAEIQRLERLLWEEYAGRKCFIFPARTFGQRCGNCYDGPSKGKGYTSQRTVSRCVTCFDTTFHGGYMSPIEVFMQIDPSAKAVQSLPISERQQADTTARLPNFPLVKPKDLVVESENRRWRVVTVNATERLRSVVHQELTLHEVSPGDIEFQLPINIDDVGSFEPSPMRNFSNPRNLDAVTNESLKHIMDVYGY